MTFRRPLIPLLLLMALQAGVSPAQQVEFFGESLRFIVNDDHVNVQGLYFFRNTGEKEVNQAIYYPIPTPNNLRDVDEIEVVQLGKREVVSHVQLDKGIRFGIKIEPGKEAGYRIEYRQKHDGNRFSYILTSTQAWGKSLEFAYFDMEIAKEKTIKFFSYTPDTVQYRNNTAQYSWILRDFIPKQDFIVEFR